MSSEETAKEAPPGGVGPAAQSPFAHALLPILSAIGTGIGAIGFVVFFGGFILWSRFDAVGLPAEDGVAHVPRGELVATGASFLVPAILAALVAAAFAVAGWDLAIGSGRRDRSRRAAKERLETTELIGGLEEEAMQLERNIEKLREEKPERDRAADQAAVGSVELEQARQAQDAAKLERQRCEARLERLREVEIPEAKKTQKKAAADEANAKNRSTSQRYTEYAMGAVPMALAEGIVVVIALAKVSFLWDGLLLLGVVAATFVVAIVVVSMTEHFAWYTLCVFLGVGITVAFATHVRTQGNPKVSPLAALYGAVPVTGFFVAETSDAVYLGSPEPEDAVASPDDELEFDHEAVTLVRVPKDSLSGLTIGPIMNEDDAYRRAISLALVLCRRLRESSEGPTDRRSRCARKSRQDLRKRLALAGGVDGERILSSR